MATNAATRSQKTRMLVSRPIPGYDLRLHISSQTLGRGHHGRQQRSTTATMSKPLGLDGHPTAAIFSTMGQRLIAFGDSITLGHWDEAGGWIAHVRRASDRQVVKTERKHYATVYNLGISSNTSRHVLERYRAEIDARHDPTDGIDLVIVLAVGINDSAVNFKTGQHLVAAVDYEANMRTLVALAKQDAEGRVLVVGLTPVDESKTTPVEYREDREYRLDLINVYNDIARQIAEGAGVHFVDLFDEMRPHSGHWHTWDGVHLNSNAHELVARLIAPKLASIGWGPDPDCAGPVR
jgi:lysophospholipase L1-like esterase